MRERDAVAIIILFVFLGWLIAVIIGLRIVNSWVYTPLNPLASVAQQS